MKQQDFAKITRVVEFEGYDDRCKVFFSFDAETSSEEENDSTAFLGSLVRNNEYNVIARIPDGKTLEDLSKKLVDTKALFTVYTFEIKDLFEGSEYEGITEVWNGDDEKEKGFRAYSSFNKAYVGKFDEEKSAFDNVRRKLLQRIEEEEYFIPIEHEEEQPKEQQKEQPKRGRR